MAYWCTGAGKTALAIGLMHRFLPLMRNEGTFFNVLYVYPTGTSLDAMFRSEVPKFVDGPDAADLTERIRDYNYGYGHNGPGMRNGVITIKSGQCGRVLENRLRASKELRRAMGHGNTDAGDAPERTRSTGTCSSLTKPTILSIRTGRRRRTPT